MKLFVALEIQHFYLKIFSFNSYVYYVTRGFIATTRAFDLLTRAFNLATRAFSPLTRGFELVFYFSTTEAYSGVFNNGSYNDTTFFFSISSYSTFQRNLKDICFLTTMMSASMLD